MRSTFIQLTVLSVLTVRALAQTAYANDFVDPDYILAKNFGAHTYRAQQEIISWAQRLARPTVVNGPWSVMDKSVNPPSGDKHDYLSWAPYWWPDCSGVGNTTALTPEQVWTTCPYRNRDGQFNPDGRLVNDVGNFQDMSEAVFYNAIAWTFGTNEASKFENDAVRFIRAWFLDTETRMNPHLNFGQMKRGPDGQVGSHTGLLDLKGMAKITSAILLLRKGGSTVWTSELDSQMIAWAREYIQWMETAEISIEEREAENNHGTFFYNQLAALKILVDDLPGAKEVTTAYFNTQYLYQIEASGEQPLEAARTRPYHYRAYNLAATITNARLDQFASKNTDAFHKRTNAGSTIQTALDFAMTISATDSSETRYAAELYPNIAAVASVYGDPEGKYLAFLKKSYPSFMSEPFILWNQPWAEGESSGLAPASRVASSPTSTSRSKATKSAAADDAASGALAVRSAIGIWYASALACIPVAALFFNSL
ncbi:unnamed protein product [Cyclocybe aegerita]|uniref:Alginate lyase domain-containing protein n=1 Tax=Cyclocybe aegerita TaxID=1973307 RepID=A0A8S0VV59_CYCAE|nr:unnamed protein product [Cyclocybe aegerita]